jgi:N-acyl homoserine lactone hydrolase
MIAETSTPERLYLMQVASYPPSNTPAAVCYLIQTSEGSNILIDSGMPINLHLTPVHLAKREQMGLPEPTMGKTILEQLALLGLGPEDIDWLICSHFDYDHSGFHASFRRAECIVQRHHYEMARDPQSPLSMRYAPTRDQWDHPASRYRLVEGDTRLLDGLELLETSGHAYGHQSVLLRLPQTGLVLLALDAVVTQEQFTADRTATPFDEDEEALRASTRKLLDLVQRRRVSLVIFEHDRQQWQTLKKVPHYYH